MVNYSTELKTWGDTGVEYPDGYSYLEGEQPVDAWDNFTKHNTIKDIQHLISLTNERIESDYGAAGSEPTSPESSHLYHDQDNEELKYWDSTASVWTRLLAANGDTLSGALNFDGNAAQNIGSLSMSGVANLDGNNLVDDTTTVWDAANGHVPQSVVEQGSGSGLDADTLDGNEASSFIQSSSEIDHDSITGVSANDHHTEPTAGTGIVDEADNQFGIATGGVGKSQIATDAVGKDEFDAAEYVIDNPNVTLPLTALEDGESIEKFIEIDDGETLNIYYASALKRDSSISGGSTGLSGLTVEVLDTDDVVVKSNIGRVQDPGGWFSYTNNSGGREHYGLRISNGTGSPIDSPGAFGNFGVVVE